MLRDECKLLECCVAGGGMCSLEMVNRLANAFKVVDTSIDDLSCRAVHL